jgi:hypothetical protein
MLLTALAFTVLICFSALVLANLIFLAALVLAGLIFLTALSPSLHNHFSLELGGNWAERWHWLEDCKDSRKLR